MSALPAPGPDYRSQALLLESPYHGIKNVVCSALHCNLPLRATRKTGPGIIDFLVQHQEMAV